MLVVEDIPFKSFREKIRITKAYGKAKMEIYQNYIYVEYKLKK